MDNALIIDLVLAAVLAVFARLGARARPHPQPDGAQSVVVALIGATTLLTAMFVEPVTDPVYPEWRKRSPRAVRSAIFRPTRWASRRALTSAAWTAARLRAERSARFEALDTLKRLVRLRRRHRRICASVTDSAVSAAGGRRTCSSRPSCRPRCSSRSSLR